MIFSSDTVYFSYFIRFTTFNPLSVKQLAMTAEQDESEVLNGLFEEIMKMIRQKQIKIESIVHRSIEQEIMSQDSFMRIRGMLDEYGKKKQWT